MSGGHGNTTDEVDMPSGRGYGSMGPPGPPRQLNALRRCTTLAAAMPVTPSPSSPLPEGVEAAAGVVLLTNGARHGLQGLCGHDGVGQRIQDQAGMLQPG